MTDVEKVKIFDAWVAQEGLSPQFNYVMPANDGPRFVVRLEMDGKAYSSDGVVFVEIALSHDVGGRQNFLTGEELAVEYDKLKVKFMDITMSENLTHIAHDGRAVPLPMYALQRIEQDRKLQPTVTEPPMVADIDLG